MSLLKYIETSNNTTSIASEILGNNYEVNLEVMVEDDEIIPMFYLNTLKGESYEFDPNNPQEVHYNIITDFGDRKRDISSFSFELDNIDFGEDTFPIITVLLTNN